ncbi:MAG: PEP-CTERM sorting domain-containing protein, partial [Sedimentisphaerales bacterium]|nr:PEP-CTERM sorting domain-containing protein [Sedimentisphaerales bacterium]
KKMKKLIIIAMFVMTLSPTVYGYTYSDYDWNDFSGHQYALTNNYGTWDDCQAEAVSVGGYLVTINDEEENAWLTNFIKDTYFRIHEGNPPPLPDGSNAAWIGYRLFEEEWGWVNAEPVTYTNYDYQGPLTWDSYTGLHGYLHGVNHPEPRVWNHSPEHDTFYDHNIRGIIEIPEPATLLLLTLGGLILRRK